MWGEKIKIVCRMFRSGRFSRQPIPKWRYRDNQESEKYRIDKNKPRRYWQRIDLTASMLMIGHLLENLNSHWSKMKTDHPLVTLGRRVAWMLSAKLSIFIRHTLQGAVQRFFASTGANWIEAGAPKFKSWRKHTSS